MKSIIIPILYIVTILTMSFTSKISESRIVTKNENLKQLSGFSLEDNNYKMNNGSRTISFGVLKCFFLNDVFTSTTFQNTNSQRKMNSILAKY